MFICANKKQNKPKNKDNLKIKKNLDKNRHALVDADAATWKVVTFWMS